MFHASASHFELLQGASNEHLVEAYIIFGHGIACFRGRVGVLGLNRALLCGGPRRWIRKLDDL